MPSLMALKKALQGRQPGSFRESFISTECFYKVLLKKYRGELKKITKEKRLEVMHWRSEGRP